MLHQTREHGVAVPRVAELPLVVVVDAGEDALQRAVLLLQCRARLVQRLADVGGRPLDRAPPRPVRHEELVLVRIGPHHRLGHAVGDELLRLFLEAVRQPLQEQQAEDVGLVVAAVDRPAQDVGRRPEVLLELGDAQHLLGRARRNCGWSRRRWRLGYLVGAPRCSGRHHQAHDEICLPPSGIIQTERPAQLLQAIPGEVPENLIHTSPARPGKRVDELRLDAAIGDRQLVIVDIRAELLGSHLGKDRALRRHWRVFTPPSDRRRAWPAEAPQMALTPPTTM